MPTARAGLVVAEVNGRIYAIGGFGGADPPLNVVEAYNPVTNSWEGRAPMPTARRGLAVAVADARIYAIGGSSGTHFLRTLETYDPASNTWTRLAPLPKGRTEFAAASVGGRVYAFAGVASCLDDDRSGACDFADTRTFEYDPASNTWTERAASPARIIQVAVAIRDLIYVVEAGSTAVYAYSPATDTFRMLASMNLSRGQPGHAALVGKAYVMGGGTPGGSTNAMEAFDPAANTWVFETPMPTRRGALGAAMALGRIYAIGGGNEAGILATNEEFSLVTEVVIDIKPGNFPNPIPDEDPDPLNLSAKGVVPVAIFTTGGFDASMVNASTVQFAGAPALRSTLEDVDLDGDLDMVLHFDNQALQLTCADTQAMLTGQTTSGTSIEGVDSIRVLKDKNGNKCP